MKVSTLRESFKVLAILFALGWFFLIAYQSRFHQILIILMTLGTLAVILIAVSRTNFRRIWLAGLIVMLAADVIGGRVSVFAADGIDRLYTLNAKAVEENVAASLEKFGASAGTIPDCPWSCMVQDLMKTGVWNGTVKYRVGPKEETGYLKEIPLRDKWGCLYEYTRLDEHKFTIASSGPDRRFGTRDDIIYNSWEKTAAKPAK